MNSSPDSEPAEYQTEMSEESEMAVTESGNHRQPGKEQPSRLESESGTASDGEV